MSQDEKWEAFSQWDVFNQEEAIKSRNDQIKNNEIPSGRTSSYVGYAKQVKAQQPKRENLGLGRESREK